MNIKDKIQEQIKRNEEIVNFLGTRGRDYEKADEIIADYLGKVSDWNFDSGLTNDFAICLQLSNSESNFKQYELGDIRALLQSGVKLQKYNLEAYLELGHFEYAVMDNTDDAEAIIDEGLKGAKEMVAELTQLKEAIKADKSGPLKHDSLK